MPISSDEDARPSLPRDPWRESLAASRERRVTAFRRRRRRLRGRSGAAVLFASLTVMAGGALAAPAEPTGGASLRAGTTGGSVTALQRALGVTADGIFGPQTRAAVKRFQLSHGLTPNGIAGPETLSVLGVSGGPTAGAATAGATTRASSQLERIAQCESGGDPTAISPDGTYRGKYQFSRATWRAVGGAGDPAAAPEAEQDRRAEILLEQQGLSAWPVCSRA